MSEREIPEEVLRRIVDPQPTDKPFSDQMRVASAAAALLEQMEDLRRHGGDPVCLVYEDGPEKGKAFVFDAAERMGS